jgi:hypothetical protein
MRRKPMDEAAVEIWLRVNQLPLKARTSTGSKCSYSAQQDTSSPLLYEQLLPNNVRSQQGAEMHIHSRPTSDPAPNPPRGHRIHTWDPEKKVAIESRPSQNTYPPHNPRVLARALFFFGTFLSSRAHAPGQGLTMEILLFLFFHAFCVGGLFVETQLPVEASPRSPGKTEPNNGALSAY